MVQNDFDSEQDDLNQTSGPIFFSKPSSSDIEKRILDLPDKKGSVYRMFELENKSLDEIALKLGIAPGTVATYLTDGIMYGLPINFTRLGVTMEQVNRVEQAIRKAPINSSSFFFSNRFFA